ncbi:MAG: hypothetical protein FJ304_24235 [Planctomycetes bacterium]|nr:hypothetical protein [Planctomycetota bacterium]
MIELNVCHSWAARLVVEGGDPRDELIREVVPFDRRPIQWNRSVSGVPNDIIGRWFFAMSVPPAGDRPHWIPAWLSAPHLWIGDVRLFCGTASYATREDAATALGRAVALWGREHLTPAGAE